MSMMTTVMKSLSCQLMARRSSVTSIVCNSLSVITGRYYMGYFLGQDTIYYYILATTQIYAPRNAHQHQVLGVSVSLWLS